MRFVALMHDSIQTRGPGNTYFGTLSLLVEAAADVTCDRNASVRERALLSFAALAKKKVPARQRYTQPGLGTNGQDRSDVTNSQSVKHAL